MFGSILWLVCPFCADPSDIRPAAPPPPPNVVAPGRNHSDVAKPRAVIGDVASILGCWEAASKQQDVPSQSQRENLRLRVSTSLNGHAAIAAEKLVGTVDTAQLQEQFDWRLIEQAGRQVCLEASPKDETERLFFGSIRVWLDPSSWRIEKLQVADRQGIERVNWAAEPVIFNVAEIEKVAHVETVSAVDDVVRPPRRFVDAKVSSDRTRGILPIPGLGALVIPLNTESPRDPVDASPVTPELAKILEKLEAAGRETKTVKLQFSRTVRNIPLEEERRSKGELFYDVSGNVSFVLRPEKIERHQPGNDSARSSRIGKNGNPYRVAEDRAESWFVTPTELVLCNDDDKTFEIIPFPAELDAKTPRTQRGSGFRSMTPWPFLFTIDAEQARREWELKIQGTSKNSVIIIATPRTDMLKTMFRECWIRIDPNSRQISAVKYFDPTGNLETVYTISDREINPRLPANGFRPNLKTRGYKLVVGPASE